MFHYAIAINAALVAGNAILSVYHDKHADWQIEKKADNSPLTLADKTAHRVIADRLKITGLPILSEESVITPYDERKQWQRFWLIDPLDGTKEFINRNGEFTVNIALIENGKPVFGVVYAPVQERLYLGIPGRGSYLVESASHVEWNTVDELIGQAQILPLYQQKRPYRVVASRSHLSPETRQFIGKLQYEHPDLECVSKGSSLKICQIAEGEADIYPRLAPTMEWDTAAAHAVVCHAGKRLHAYDGDELSYNKEDLHNPWFVVE